MKAKAIRSLAGQQQEAGAVNAAGWGQVEQHVPPSPSSSPQPPATCRRTSNFAILRPCRSRRNVLPPLVCLRSMFASICGLLCARAGGVVCTARARTLTAR